MRLQMMICVVSMLAASSLRAEHAHFVPAEIAPSAMECLLNRHLGKHSCTFYNPANLFVTNSTPPGDYFAVVLADPKNCFSGVSAKTADGDNVPIVVSEHSFRTRSHDLTATNTIIRLDWSTEICK